MSKSRTNPPSPRIEITPTPAQYKQLCRDLQLLRESGAPSNTAAILDAVRAAAGNSKIFRVNAKKRRAASGGRPRPGTRRSSPDAVRP